MGFPPCSIERNDRSTHLIVKVNHLRMRQVRLIASALVLGSMAACVPPTPPPVTTAPPPGATGPSPGCGTTTRGPVTDRAETVVVAGATRRFTVTVPPIHTPGTTTALPLVLDFHGLLEGWAGTHPYATQFSAKAIAEGFVVAFPIGSDDGIYWDVALHEANPDLQFIDALVVELGRALCIDRSRMYITGLSFGGAMTSMLICMRANTFAAAAPVSGMRNLCTATQRMVPFVTFHGTDDPILPYWGFAETPQRVAAKFGCGAPRTSSVGSGPDPATGGAIVHTSWDCGGSSDAEFYRIDGGGHSWPGSDFFRQVAPIVGTTSSLDATDVIWDFFERHRLG